jgi:hypothetical protein
LNDFDGLVRLAGFRFGLPLCAALGLHLLPLASRQLSLTLLK